MWSRRQRSARSGARSCVARVIFAAVGGRGDVTVPTGKVRKTAWDGYQFTLCNYLLYPVLGGKVVVACQLNR